MIRVLFIFTFAICVAGGLKPSFAQNQQEIIKTRTPPSEWKCAFCHQVGDPDALGWVLCEQEDQTPIHSKCLIEAKNECPSCHKPALLPQTQRRTYRFQLRADEQNEANARIHEVFRLETEMGAAKKNLSQIAAHLSEKLIHIERLKSDRQAAILSGQNTQTIDTSLKDHIYGARALINRAEAQGTWLSGTSILKHEAFYYGAGAVTAFMPFVAAAYTDHPILLLLFLASSPLNMIGGMGTYHAFINEVLPPLYKNFAWLYFIKELKSNLKRRDPNIKVPWTKFHAWLEKTVNEIPESITPEKIAEANRDPKNTKVRDLKVLRRLPTEVKAATGLNTHTPEACDPVTLNTMNEKQKERCGSKSTEESREKSREKSSKGKGH